MPVLKKVKPWGEGPAFKNLMSVAGVFQLQKDDHPFFRVETLGMLKARVNTVKSEQFAPLQGKVLGEAIDTARTDQVQRVLTEIKDPNRYED